MDGTMMIKVKVHVYLLLLIYAGSHVSQDILKFTK